MLLHVNFFYANNFSSTFLTKFRNYFFKIHTHANLYSLLDISYQVQKLFFQNTHWCWPVQTPWVETKWPRGQPVTHWPLWRTSDWVQLVQNLPSLEQLKQAGWQAAGDRKRGVALIIIKKIIPIKSSTGTFAKRFHSLKCM